MTSQNLRQVLPERFHEPFQQLGFGAAQFGNLGRKTTDEECEGAFAEAWSSGLRYFDTAPHYGLGLSERRLGQALRQHPRDSYVLSTKVGRLLRPNPHPQGSDAENGFHVPGSNQRVRDYTYDGVMRSLEESLQRLGTDRVDILWIHDPEEPTDRSGEALDGAVPALERLRDEGTIAAWGVGSKDPTMMKHFVDRAAPDLLMVAGRYTLLEQHHELMQACMNGGVGVVAAGIFNSGLLAHDEPPDDARYEYGAAPSEQLAHARELASASRKHGISLPAAALAYPKRHPAVVNVIAGMRNSAQVERNVALCTTVIPEQFWTDLQAHGLLKEER